MAVITINDIINNVGAQEVTLTHFDGVSDMTVRLRRISMVELMAAGLVPNPLVQTVQDMFMGIGKVAKTHKGFFTPETCKAMIAIARQSMVEPKYSEIEEAGVSLTDQQLMEIYLWNVGGADGLATFRNRARGGAQHDGGNVQGAAVAAGGDN